MRVVLLTGGNAAGKTTALRAAQTRHATRPGWRWIYADSELDGTAPAQYKALMRLWNDPQWTGLAIEGVRIYNAVFRCARYAVTRRQLWVGLLLQDYAVGRLHIQQRCLRGGKPYRATFWDQGEAAVGHLFKSRYTGGLAKFLREAGPRVWLGEIQHFVIDEDYRELEAVGRWLDRAIGE